MTWEAFCTEIVECDDLTAVYHEDNTFSLMLQTDACMRFDTFIEVLTEEPAIQCLTLLTLPEHDFDPFFDDAVAFELFLEHGPERDLLIDSIIKKAGF